MPMLFTNNNREGSSNQQSQTNSKSTTFKQQVEANRAKAKEKDFRYVLINKM